MLWLAGELGVQRPGQLGWDVLGRLRDSHRSPAQLPTPSAAQRSAARLLEIYDTLLALPGARSGH